jgi:hypothetical protein
MIIYDYLQYATPTSSLPVKKSDSVQDVLLYIQKLLPWRGMGATNRLLWKRFVATNPPEDVKSKIFLKKVTFRETIY